MQYDQNLGRFVEDYVCLYCDKFRSTVKAEYERHVVTKHPNYLCYPGLADMRAGIFKVKKERPRDVVSELNENIRRRNRERDGQTTNVSSSLTLTG